jgi:hypothetical protein
MHRCNDVHIRAHEVRVGDRLVESNLAILEITRTRSGEVLFTTESGSRLPMPAHQFVWVARSDIDAPPNS